MPVILHIETATSVCSVALSKNGELLSIQDSSIRNAHSTILTTYIEDVLRNSGLGISQIDAVAVSKGPGSYTGLRIGVASAKGLCYSLDRPLISVSTFRAMGEGILQLAVGSWQLEKRRNLLICPMIDARRMEVFCAVFDSEGKEIRNTQAEIIEEHSFSGFLKENRIVFAGDGSEKCKTVLEKNKNALFLDDFRASAKYMISIAEQKYADTQFENLAYFEPYYLKDFIAGKPKVKGLK